MVSFRKASLLSWLAAKVFVQNMIYVGKSKSKLALSVKDTLVRYFMVEAVLSFGSCIFYYRAGKYRIIHKP